jgi:hypothetical protein
MRRLSRLVGPVGVAAGLFGPVALMGQAPGLPVRNAGIATGIQLGFDLGISRGVPSGGSTKETSTGLGGTVSAGLGLVGASLFVVRFDQGGPTSAATWVGGTANVQVFGGPLIPLKVTLAGGYAMGADVPGVGRPYRATLGLGAALSIPIPIVAVVPWVSPRVEHAGNGPAGIGGTHGAISAGIDFRKLGGFLIRTAYDSRAGWATAGGTPSVVSVGVGFSIP